MTNEQRKVVAGAAAAVVFSVAFFELVFRLTAIDLTPSGGIEIWWRLEYALKCEVFAALCLLAGVGLIANRRFFLSDAIEGGASNDEAARRAGVFQPHRAREIAQKARSMRAKELERWLLVLAETDIALKSSRRQPDAILEDMLTRLSRTSR